MLFVESSISTEVSAASSLSEASASVTWIGYNRICKTVLSIWERASYKGLTEYVKALKQKTVRLRAVFCLSKAGGSWGLGMLNPQQVPALYIQGGTCSTLCDFNGAPADLGRLASAMATFLLENDAQATGRFLKAKWWDNSCKTGVWQISLGEYPQAKRAYWWATLGERGYAREGRCRICIGEKYLPYPAVYLICWSDN